MNSVLASSEEKRHLSIVLSHLQKSVVPLFLNNVGISCTNEFQILYDTSKLKAGNSKPIHYNRG